MRGSSQPASSAPPKETLDQAVSRVTRESIDASLAEIAKAFDALFADRDEWRTQHEALLEVRQQDIAFLGQPASSAGEVRVAVTAIRNALRVVRDDWPARKEAAEWGGRPVAHVDDMLLGLITFYDRATLSQADKSAPRAEGEGEHGGPDGYATNGQIASSGRPEWTGQEPGSTDTTTRLRRDSDPDGRADTVEQAYAPAGCDGPEDIALSAPPADGGA